MTIQEFDSYRLRTLAMANGRNVHDLPPLLAYMKRAVICVANNEDIDFSNNIIALGRKSIQRILRK
jgi:hypothetical protein